jgi:hypothetical protein
VQRSPDARHSAEPAHRQSLPPAHGTPPPPAQRSEQHSVPAVQPSPIGAQIVPGWSAQVPPVHVSEQQSFAPEQLCPIVPHAGPGAHIPPEQFSVQQSVGIAHASPIARQPVPLQMRIPPPTSSHVRPAQHSPSAAQVSPAEMHCGPASPPPGGSPQLQPGRTTSRKTTAQSAKRTCRTVTSRFLRSYRGIACVRELRGAW